MMKIRMPRALVVLGLAILALVVVATAAQAQGVMFVKNNRVGIGTSNPQVPLHILNPSNPAGDSFAGMGASPQLSAGEGFNFGYAASVSGGFLNTRSGGFTQLLLMTSNTARLRFNGTNGRITFGTSVLGAPAAAHPLVHNDSGAHLTAGGAWTNASSRALKRDIAELPASLAFDALRGLNPVTYEYAAEPGESYVGFIAEEVPDLVASGDRKGLASMDVVAVLTKVVQEQQSTIEELTRRLQALEER